MLHKNLRLTGAFLVVPLALASGCGGDTTGPGPMTVADLAGSWGGTAFALVSNDNPAYEFDLIGSGGTMTMSVTATGTFTGTAVLPGALVGQPGAVTLPLSGVVRLTDGENLRIDFIPEIPPIFRTMNPAFSLVGNTLTLTDNALAFDFDSDGQEEAATYRGTFLRN